MASSDGGMMTFYIEEIIGEEGEGEEVVVEEEEEEEEGTTGGVEGGKKKRKKKKKGSKKKQKNGGQATRGGGDSDDAGDDVDVGGLRWEEVEVTGGARPEGRGGGSLTKVGESLLLFGGADRVQRHFGELHEYNLGTKMWSIVELQQQHTTTTSSPPPCPRSGHTSVLLSDGRGVVVFGGIHFTDEAVFGDTHLFDTELRVWRRLRLAGGGDGDGSTPPPRNSHTATALKGRRMVVFGGSSPEEGPMGDVWLLTVEGDYGDGDVNGAWSRPVVKGKGPEAREMHAACLLGGGDGGSEVEEIGERVVVMGGRRMDGTVERDLWVLDTGAWTWSQLPSAPTPRCAHGLFCLPTTTTTSGGGGDDGDGGGKGVGEVVTRTEGSGTRRLLWVFGGFDGVAEVFDDAMAFDLASGAWCKEGRQSLRGGGKEACKARFGMATTTTTGAAAAAAAAAGDGGVYVFGGVNVMEDLNDLIRIAM